MTKINLKNIPTKPGVYIFKKGNKYLYIGKAINLRNRIKQYLNKKTTAPFLDYLLKEAKNLTIKTTDSEIEAFILESQLIKKYKPKYNIKLKDDKKYFYVGFTKEEFPKLFLTHQPNQVQVKNNKKEAEFIGPFTDGSSLKTTLKFLRKIFPYCTCKQKHHNFCLNYHIGNCIGYCCLTDNAFPKNLSKNNIIQKYKQNIQSIKSILNGRKKILITKFKKEMKQMVQKQDFENAIEIKNKIEKLENVFENARIINQMYQTDRLTKVTKKLKKIFNLKTLPKRIEAYDISNIQGENATGSMIVFENNKLNKKEYRKFKIKITSKPNDVAMLKEVLDRRFNHPEWRYPDLILIDGGKAQINAAIKIIKSRKLNIPVISLSKQGKKILSSTLKGSIALDKLNEKISNLIKLLDSEAHRFAIKFYRKVHRRKMI